MPVPSRDPATWIINHHHATVPPVHPTNRRKNRPGYAERFLARCLQGGPATKRK